MPDTRTAVAKRPDPLSARMAYVEKIKDQIARALPRHLDGDRMARLALTAIRQTPDLALCSEISFAGAIMQSAALGLEPNTPTGESYLVPYGVKQGKGEVQLIVGYKGYSALYHRHPGAGALDSGTVYEADDFDYEKGSNAYLRHKEALDVPIEERGAIRFYWAQAYLLNGKAPFEILRPDQVKELRQGKVGVDAKFKGGDPQHWMERKTVVRQLFKLLPQTPNMARAAAVDEASGTELYRAAAAERLDLDPGSGGPSAAEAAAPSAEQIAALLGRLGDHGLETDAERQAWIEEKAGRPIPDPAVLTAAEVETMLAALPEIPVDPQATAEEGTR